MLQIDLRELALGPVETAAELAKDDPLLAGLEVGLAEPVRVGGRLQATGEERFYWHGTLDTFSCAASTGTTIRTRSRSARTPPWWT